MRQNINLYQAVLIDKPEPLQARQSGLVLLAFLVLLFGAALINYWQLHSRQRLLVDLQLKETRRSAEVLQLEQQFPPQEKDARLAAELRRTEQQLAGEKQLLGFFAARKNAGNELILGTLEGLAKNVRSGVWLKRIQLDGSGRKVELAGTAIQPEQVPAYLQYLGQQGVFSGQVFSRLKLVRLKERPGQVDFSLESMPEGEQ